MSTVPGETVGFGVGLAVGDSDGVGLAVGDPDGVGFLVGFGGFKDGVAEADGVPAADDDGVPPGPFAAGSPPPGEQAASAAPNATATTTDL